MKNKKLIVTAIAAAIVVSMQASTVFAAEVSDSDLEQSTVQTQAAGETENLTEDEGAEDEIDEDEAAQDEIDEEAAEDEIAKDEAAEDETADNEEAEDEPTIEDIQALIDGFIAEYKENPDADEEETAQIQAILEGLLTEITQSERFLNSELTLAELKEYFEMTVDGFRFDDNGDDDAETVTSGQCGDNLTWNFDEETGTLTISHGRRRYVRL